MTFPQKSHVFLRAALVALCLAPALPAARAQQDDNPADALIRAEQVRERVQLALEEITTHSGSGDAHIEMMTETALEMQRTGPEAVPYLANELRQRLQETYFVAAYALAWFDTPEAHQALAEALEQADREDNDFAIARKAWAAYAMGMHGDAESIRLANEGRLLTGHYPIHSRVSTVEAIAYQTSPDCLPIIAAEIERIGPGREDKIRLERRMLIQALGRPRDPAAVPILLGLLDEDHWSVRFEAARSLARIGSPEAVAALLSLLDDKEFIVRRTVANQLETLLGPDKLDKIVARLEKEDDDITRGLLYRVVATAAGASGVETLRQYWPRRAATDREYLIQAAALTGSPEALALLRAGLGDATSKVTIYALNGLVRLDVEESWELVRSALRSDRWPLAQTAIDAVVRRGDSRAAPVIAARLIENEMTIDIVDTARRERAMKLAGALVELEHTAAIDGLRKALEPQHDARLVNEIENVLSRLELLKKNGEKREAWQSAAEHEDERHRFLAYRKLARLGGDESARILERRFGRVALADGVEILRALGELDTPTSRALLRRVLLEAPFDGVEIIRLREMAAWSARRLGGEEMREALFQSVRRRDGREGMVTLYAAVLGGEAALPLLAEIRQRRMRYLKWSRGQEQERLDLIERQIRRGLSVYDHDVPPEMISFR